MKILKKYSILLTLILAFSINVSAATKLTPMHIYKWAKNHNISRIHQFKKYINLHDQNQNLLHDLISRSGPCLQTG